MSGQSTLGRTHIYTVTSKNKFYVRRPSTFTLILTGGFPAELASSVWALFNKKLDMDTFGTDPVAMKKYAEMVERYWPFVLVKLRVVADDQEIENHADEHGCIVGTCHANDLDDLDKQDLFLYGIGLSKPDEELNSDERARLDAIDVTKGSTPEPLSEEATVRDLDSFREGAERDNDRPRREPVRTETVEPVGAAVDAPDGA